MNAADLAIGAVIAISVLVGLIRGFVVEVMSLVVWVAAFGLAVAFGPALAELFVGRIELPSARAGLGYALVFIAALLMGAVLVFVLRKVVRGTGLTGTDRLLGLVFGLVRGALVVVLIVLLAGLTPFPRDPWWRESRALPAFEQLATRLVAWLPEPLARHIDFGHDAVEPPEAPATPAPDGNPA